MAWHRPSQWVAHCKPIVTTSSLVWNMSGSPSIDELSDTMVLSGLTRPGITPV